MVYQKTYNVFSKLAVYINCGMVVRFAVTWAIIILPIVMCHRQHPSDGIGQDNNCPQECLCYTWPPRSLPGHFEANCSHRLLKTLPSQFSVHVISLKASFNGFEKIPNDFFNPTLVKLVKVDFSNNSISSIGEKTFKHLPVLWIANFTGNNIESLHHETFQSNLKLWYLVLRGNRINVENSSVLLNAPKLEKLDLSYNNIRTLKDTTFSKMPNIVYLRLHNNQLKTLHSSWFRPLKKLERLYLEHNRLTHLDSDTFIHTPRLFELALSWNDLIIPSNVPFLRVPNLEYLHMTGCDLGSIPYHMFDEIPRVRMLWINSNRLSSISTGMLNSLQSLRFLNACDNNFVCSCELKDLWQSCYYREIQSIVNCAFEEYPTVASTHNESLVCEGNWDLLVDMACNITNNTIPEAQSQDQEEQESHLVYLMAYVSLGVSILLIVIGLGGFLYWKYETRRSSNRQNVNLVYPDMMPLNDERED